MDLFDKAEIDFHDLAQECKREVEMRRRVYPKWVHSGRITDADAQRRLAIMVEAARLFQLAAEMRDQDPLKGSAALAGLS